MSVTVLVTLAICQKLIATCQILGEIHFFCSCVAISTRLETVPEAIGY
jgi:hypothetical protein